MGKYLIAIILYSFFVFQSCDSKKEDIPSYIQIDTVEVEIKDQPKEGSSSHSISDVWIYIDDVYQGNYEIPAKFPVLSSGKHSITLRAGIKRNGIAASREEYPFYNYVKFDTILTEATILNLTPKFSYISNAKFWIEDFNDVDIKIGTTPYTDTDTTIQLIADTNHIGESYGAIYVNSERPDFIASTNMETDPIYYSTSSRRLFLELEYKNNQYFYVGLHTDTELLQVEMINPSDNWKKIYIDLTQTIINNPKEKYALVFSALYNGEQQGEIFLNNIKLVSYE